MLEDIQATLSELDKVAFCFRQLDECFVASEFMPFICPLFPPHLCIFSCSALTYPLCVPLT